MSSSPSVPFKPQIVSNRDQWEAARGELLEEEKKYTRMRDQLTEKRLKLPFYQLTPQEIESLQFYPVDQPDQPKTIYDLFNETNRLLIYNCMSFKEYPCGACTVVIDQLNSIHSYLQSHAHTMVISRCSIQRLTEVVKVKGWTIPAFTCNIAFTQLVKNDCTNDPSVYRAIPGMSSFYLDRSSHCVYLTYSSFNRGVEDLECYFNWFDRIPLSSRSDRGHPFYEWPVDESGRTNPDLDERHKNVTIAP